jgi:hypothetical protein
LGRSAGAPSTTPRRSSGRSVCALRTPRSLATNCPRSQLPRHHHSAAPSESLPNSSPAGGARQPACSGTADDSPIAPSTHAIDAESWHGAAAFPDAVLRDAPWPSRREGWRVDGWQLGLGQYARTAAGDENSAKLGRGNRGSPPPR